MKKGPNGHSYPFGSQCECWRVDRAFLSKHGLRLLVHSAKGEKPKSIFGLEYLLHKRIHDDRDEAFADSDADADEDAVDGIDFSVVGSCC